MTETVFISYAAADREKAAPLVDALTAAGIDVWWDQNISGGEHYRNEIEKALEAATRVIVCWSEHGNASDWVKDEAEMARDMGKLLPISLDGVLPPMGFRQYQVTPYPDGQGTDRFDPIIDMIKNRAGAGALHAASKGVPAAGARRRSFIAMGLALIAAASGLYFFTRSQAPVVDESPLVIVMDSAHPKRIYDESVIAAGGTNADILSDILSDLPIRTQKELISPAWHRQEAILQFDPDLIVIHYSGFKQADASGDRPLLRLLIEYMADSDTQFLVYSRASEDWLQTKMDGVLETSLAKYPGLSDRVEIFPVIEYGEPNWSDPLTAQAMKLRVKSILDLETD